MSNNVIDFLEFKNSGSLQYVDVPEEARSDKLDEMSFVMEMSTDELISEVGCRMEYGQSLRDVSDDVLIDELHQRLTAMQFLVAAFTHLRCKGSPQDDV